MKTWLQCLYAMCLCAVCLSASAAADLMSVDHWQRDGLSVYRVHAAEVPMTQVVLLFNAGAAYDPKPGTSSLTAALLDQGAKGLSEQQLVDALGDEGAILQVGSDLTHAWVSLQSTTQAWPASSRLLLRALNQPRFSQKAIARRQQQMVSELKMLQQSPAYITGLSFRQHLFAWGPLRHPVLGSSSKAVMALKRDDVTDFYHRHFGVANAALLVVGQADHAAVDDLAHRLSQVLPDGKAVTLPASDVAHRAHLTMIETPYQSAQSHVVVGQVLPQLHIDGPEYWPLVVANDILGGSGLNSKLFEAVRNQRGLAYSVSSGFQYLPDRMVWQMSMQTNHRQADQASHVLLNAAKTFIAQGPSEEALAAAKRHLMGALPLQFDSNAKRMQRLMFLVVHHLPLNWYANEIEHIRKVTVEDIKHAMHNQWQSQPWLMVTVGPQFSEHK